MTATTRSQLQLLALLVVAAAALFWLRSGPTPAGDGAPASNPARGAAPAAASQGTVADVQLELLKAPREELAPAERNPFRFEERPQPAPPRQAAPPSPVVVAPPVPTGPPPPPPIPLKFIGILDGPASLGRVAMLSDGRGGTFNGREGDIIEGRYQILKIGTESVDVAYTDGRGRQTIRLSGQ